MAKLAFYPVDIVYKIIADAPVIHMYGRTVEGKRVLVLDDSFKPYFFVLTRRVDDINRIRDKVFKLEVEKGPVKAKVIKCEIVKKSLIGKEHDLLKVFVNIPKGIPVIREVVHEWDDVEDTFEYDILFIRRYLIDKRIVPFSLVEAEVMPFEGAAKVDSFNLVSIDSVSDKTIAPKVLSLDIETYDSDNQLDMNKNPILMIGLYGRDFQKVITWKGFPTELSYVEFASSEKDMIERFKQYVEDFEPDIFTGYFSDGFDLPYIAHRAKLHKLKLDLGLDFSDMKIYGRDYKEAVIEGISHLDVFRFVRNIIGRTLKTDSYSLDNVAHEIIGSNKIQVDILELSGAWDNDPSKLESFAEYNLVDAKLAFDLFNSLFPQIVELVRIVGLLPSDVIRMSISQLVEAFIFKNAPKFNEVAPNRPSYQEYNERVGKSIKGGFVFEPKPGLYQDIMVFDFRSLYPSIIASHNISIETLRHGKADSKNSAPVEDNPIWFSEEKKGFLSSLIIEIITSRIKISEKLKEEATPILIARSLSLKLLANSFYGYLGYARARWYSKDCARAVTSWGRHYIHKVIGKAKEAGFEVVYGDSLPYDRNIIIQKPNKEIRILKIGDLFESDWRGCKTLAFEKGRASFKPLMNVIKHKLNGDLLLIKTNYGSTVVTDQHSVYSYDKGISLVHAGELKKGDCLISLTNPSFKEIYRKGHIFDITGLDLGHYKDELFLYSDDLCFPNRKGICPYCKKDVSLSAHVYAKHKERKTKFSSSSLFSFIGTRYGKAGKIPRYWTLDEDLAWLLGFYCAEGSVSDVKTKTGRKALLSFGGQDIERIKRVKSILDRILNADLSMIENHDKRTNKFMYYYRVQRAPIIALFEYGFGAGKRSDKKKVPWFILSSEEKIRRAFLEGYLDGDGNQEVQKRYKTKFIEFSTKSKDLAIGLQFLCKSLNHGKNAHQKKVEHVYWGYRKDKPGICKLRVQSSKNAKTNYCLAEIKEIEKAPSEEYVYDLEVKGSHNFVDAEGMILVHNTDSVMIHLKDKSKDDALDFQRAINKDLPGVMELEYEGYHPAGLFVSMKFGEGGAKKKYALLNEDKTVKIRGFEAIRRNWSPIAKEVQEKVLQYVLADNDADKAFEYVRDIIKQLNKHDIPVDKVVMSTQLTKNISSYDSFGPHVRAAIRMKEKGITIQPGLIVRYVVTKGKGRIGDRVMLPDEVSQSDYDPDYYANNQIIPAVSSIFDALGLDSEDLSPKQQSSLQSFMK